MIQFIVHDEDDSVGVVTVEGLKANDTHSRMDNGSRCFNRH